MPKSRAVSFVQRSSSLEEVRSRVELPCSELARPSAAEGARLFWLGRVMELHSLRVELNTCRLKLSRAAAAT